MSCFDGVAVGVAAGVCADVGEGVAESGAPGSANAESENKRMAEKQKKRANKNLLLAIMSYLNQKLPVRTNDQNLGRWN